jgi:hypothetical protein
MAITFHLVTTDEKGRSVCYADDPKLAAYKSMAYIQNVLGRTYSLEINSDKTEYIVAAPGLETIVWKKGE